MYGPPPSRVVDFAEVLVYISKGTNDPTCLPPRTSFPSASPSLSSPPTKFTAPTPLTSIPADVVLQRNDEVCVYEPAHGRFRCPIQPTGESNGQQPALLVVLTGRRSCKIKLTPTVWAWQGEDFYFIAEDQTENSVNLCFAPGELLTESKNSAPAPP